MLPATEKIGMVSFPEFEVVRSVISQDWSAVRHVLPRIDSLKFRTLVFSQRLAGVIYYFFRKNGLLSDLPENGIYKKFFYATAERNSLLEGIFRTVSRRAFRDGIPIAPLKGLNVLRLVYPHPGMRVLSDVDLLCAPGDFKRVAGLLADLGFMPYAAAASRRDSWNADFYKATNLPGLPHVRVEVHTAVVPPRPLRVRLDALQRCESESGIAWMDRSDTFITLLGKVRRDVRMLRLFVFYDLYLLATTAPGVDWEYIRRICRNNHLVQTLQFVLRILDDFGIGTVPALRPGRRFRGYSARMIADWDASDGYPLRLALFDSFWEIPFYMWRKLFRS